MITAEQLKKCRTMSLAMRKDALQMAYDCKGSSHLGGGLSIIDIMATLYACVMKYDITDPYCENRDRFILSKGHGVLGFYPALAESGIISCELLKTFQSNGCDLIEHPVMNIPLGIESSSGSLGQGLSLGVGIALGAKAQNKDFRTFVLLGNGECNEGSVWEAVMSAAHFKLKNLTAIVDCNDFQFDGLSCDVMDMCDIAKKFESFGWNTFTVNGHDFEELYNALSAVPENDRPTAIIAKTIKGKGVSFMENNNQWHHTQLTQQSYDKAMAELEALNA